MKPFYIILVSVIIFHVGLLLIPFDPPRPPDTMYTLVPGDDTWAGMLFDQEDGLDENVVYIHCATENDLTP